MLVSIPGTIAMEEFVRLLAHGEIRMSMFLMGLVVAVGDIFLIRLVRRTTESSVRNRLRRNGRDSLRGWLDNPRRIARAFAIMAWAFPIWVISLSFLSGDWGLYRLTFGAYFAMALIWGDLRWRVGDELVCAGCDYAKSPELGEICPECGGAWTTAEGLALGRARVVPWMIGSGSLVIALDLFFVVSSL